MGDPTEDEQGDPNNCGTQQATTNGLAYWSCSSNLLTFAALPDGAMHWALASPGPGVIEWTGAQDPPLDALTVANTDTPTNAADDPPPVSTVCMAAASLPATQCAAGDAVSAQAAIQNPGDTLSVNLNVPAAGLHLTADLVNLPADYDLYLADTSGAIVDESLQEGTTPEHLDDDLPGGTYYLYVHSDPGRSVDPQDPFMLQVSVS